MSHRFLEVILGRPRGLEEEGDSGEMYLTKLPCALGLWVAKFGTFMLLRTQRIGKTYVPSK